MDWRIVLKVLSICNIVGRKRNLIMKRLILNFVGICCTLSCISDDRVKYNWPSLPLMIIDENEETLDQRDRDLQPSKVEKIVLLPQIVNHCWHGGFYKVAIGDPIFYRPRESSLLDALSQYSQGRQQVKGCIILAQGYGPVRIKPLFYRYETYKKKTYFLKDIAKLSESESYEVNCSIIKELKNKEIRVDDQIVSFKDAARSCSILSAGTLESPVLKKGFSSQWYKFTTIWGYPEGGKVPVCISNESLENMQSLLGCNHEKTLLWPSMPFLIIDENDIVVSQRTHNFKPSAIDEVVLIPQVENYKWHGKQYTLAIADPILCKPGEVPLSSLLSKLSQGKQQVRRCIVLARGYSPGGLFPLFYDTGRYNGKENIIIDLPKISGHEAINVQQTVIKELKKKEIQIRPPSTVKAAVASGSIIGPCWLESPTIKKINSESLPRSTRISLWDGFREGSKVPVCISDKGMRNVMKVLNDT